MRQLLVVILEAEIDAKPIGILPDQPARDVEGLRRRRRLDPYAAFARRHKWIWPSR
jgi:hypothetical protein